MSRAAPRLAIRTRRPVAGLVCAFALLVGAFLASSCGSTETVSSPTTTARAIVGIQRQDPIDVRALQLSDAHTNEGFSAAPARGLNLVYFGYTSCPDVCPTTLSDLRRALRTIGPAADDVALTFVTVDPERDTAEILNGYIGSFVSKFHTVRLTDPAQLAEVQEKFGAKSRIGEKSADGHYEVSHTASLYAVDATGKVVVEWPFGTPADAIAGDLADLLARPTSPATNGTALASTSP